MKLKDSSSILSDQNVLFLTRSMNLGGTENVILQLCEILKPFVNKIIVCSCGGNNVDQLRKIEISHYCIPDITQKNPKSILSIYRIISTIIKIENITIIHSHHRMAALIAILAAKKDTIKIANAHNTFYNKKLLTRLAYKSTRLIAVGESVKENLTDYFNIPSFQITVINNTIKPFDSRAKHLTTLDHYKSNSEFTLIGNVGRLTEQKGMRYFVEAAALVYEKHRNVRFLIIGDGEERDFLTQFIHDSNLDNVVFITGYLEDIQNIMSQLSFVVLSSLWEGFPLTPIEAFSVGKTIIASAVDGTPEIVQNNVNGILVPPRDVKALANAMLLLLENENILKKLGQNAKKNYMDNFSYDALSKKYINFYHAITGMSKLH